MHNTHARRVSGNESAQTGSMTWPTPAERNAIAKRVQKEQVLIARDAETHGPKHGKVIRRQLRCAASLDFRVHAVLLVTERATALGVDNEDIRLPMEKIAAVEKLRRLREYSPPAEKKGGKRKGGKKKGGKKKGGKLQKRPLGIPTKFDRCAQQLITLILEPAVEPFSDPHSYGYRKNRSAKNAVSDVHGKLATRALDLGAILACEMEGFFDNINHQWILDHIPLPRKYISLVDRWHKAGVIYKETSSPSQTGTPQGGILSPLLANMVLDGLETVVRTAGKGKVMTYSKPAIGYVRYADDVVIVGPHKRMLKHHVLPLVRSFLQERGLRLSEEKTHVHTVQERALEYLGYKLVYKDCWRGKHPVNRLRRYQSGVGLLVPAAALTKVVSEVRRQFRKMQNLDAYTVIAKLNPIIRGWSNYYNMGDSRTARDKLRGALYRNTWRWAKHKHPRWGKKRIANTYLKSELQGRTWNFHGSGNRESRRDTGRIQVRHLLDPTKCVKTLVAPAYRMPEDLLKIHAFHPNVEKVEAWNLQVRLKASGEDHSLHWLQKKMPPAGKTGIASGEDHSLTLAKGPPARGEPESRPPVAASEE